jgi:hypothetical protein
MSRFAFFAAFTLFASACSDAPRQANGEYGKLGSYTESGAFSPFYAEEVKDGRVYVFGTVASHDKFLATNEVDITKFKTYIGLGPNRETAIVQVDKDVPQMTPRLVSHFQERWPKAAAAAAAPTVKPSDAAVAAEKR